LPRSAFGNFSPTSHPTPKPRITQARDRKVPLQALTGVLPVSDTTVQQKNLLSSRLALLLKYPCAIETKIFP
jgi:hypothetical protein